MRKIFLAAAAVAALGLAACGRTVTNDKATIVQSTCYPKNLGGYCLVDVSVEDVHSRLFSADCVTGSLDGPTSCRCHAATEYCTPNIKLVVGERSYLATISSAEETGGTAHLWIDGVHQASEFAGTATVAPQPATVTVTSTND